MSNFWLTSILPFVSKTVEKWVAKLLIELLSKGCSPLHPMQFRFRAHHSTETAICIFSEMVKGLLDSNGYVSTVFLDLKSTMKFFWPDWLSLITLNMLCTALTHIYLTGNSQWLLMVLNLPVLTAVLVFHRGRSLGPLFSISLLAYPTHVKLSVPTCMLMMWWSLRKLKTSKRPLVPWHLCWLTIMTG